MRGRILYISTALIQQACKDKQSLEALSFAIDVKMMFVDSVIKNFTYRKAMSLFNISNAKLKKVIEEGQRMGYISFDGHNLTALPLHHTGKGKAYHYAYKFNDKSYSLNEAKKSRYTLREIVDQVRKMSVTNHISKQNECSDTIRRMKNPVSQAEFLKARRKANRMLRTKSAHNGLSLRRVMQVTGCSRYKARKIMRGLVCNDKVLEVHAYDVPTTLKANEFNGIEANYWFKETGHFGYLYTKDDKVMCRVSNEYNLLRRDLISLR